MSGFRIPPPPADVTRTPCRDCGKTDGGPLTSFGQCERCDHHLAAEAPPSGITVLEPGHTLAPPEGSWTLNGEPLDIGDFFNTNHATLGSDLDPIWYFRPGDSLDFGGGAWAPMVVRRVS